MENIWIIALAVIVFLIINYLLYKSLHVFVKKEFGKKWLKIWGNKVYFWQSIILVSSASAALIIFVLKRTNLVNL